MLGVETPVQRCVRHKERNVCDHLPERDQGGDYPHHRLTITPGPPSRNSTTYGTSSSSSVTRSEQLGYEVEREDVLALVVQCAT